MICSFRLVSRNEWWGRAWAMTGTVSTGVLLSHGTQPRVDVPEALCPVRVCGNCQVVILHDDTDPTAIDAAQRASKAEAP